MGAWLSWYKAPALQAGDPRFESWRAYHFFPWGFMKIIAETLESCKDCPDNGCCDNQLEDCLVAPCVENEKEETNSVAGIAQ